MRKRLVMAPQYGTTFLAWLVVLFGSLKYKNDPTFVSAIKNKNKPLNSNEITIICIIVADADVANIFFVFPSNSAMSVISSLSRTHKYLSIS